MGASGSAPMVSIPLAGAVDPWPMVPGDRPETVTNWTTTRPLGFPQQLGKSQTPKLRWRQRRRFSEEFKRDAVELVRTTGRPIAQIARELGIYDSTLGHWVRQDRIDRGKAEELTSDERARLRALEAENTKLRMERDLLKRTVAFWVKETSTP
jgi:transposase